MTHSNNTRISGPTLRGLLIIYVAFLALVGVFCWAVSQ